MLESPGKLENALEKAKELFHYANTNENIANREATMVIVLDTIEILVILSVSLEKILDNLDTIEQAMKIKEKTP